MLYPNPVYTDPDFVGYGGLGSEIIKFLFLIIMYIQLYL